MRKNINIVSHQIRTLAVGERLRDGDLDATVMRLVTPLDGANVEIQHGLQRELRAVDIIFKTAACDVMVALDPDTQQPIIDSERAVLHFTANGADVTLRMW